jgi:high-affinity K+ transport system ATPase subunit B
VADEKVADALREKLAKKARIAQAVLDTPEGKALFEVLRSEFFVRLDDAKDERQTIFKAGQADVIAYIMQLERYGR